MKFSAIYAVDEANGMGYQGMLPWGYIPQDMIHFRKTTMGGIVVMGRITFESIGKPLDGRVNCVISSTMQNIDGINIYKSPEEFIDWAISQQTDVYIIGGAQIYKWFIDNKYISYHYVTLVKKMYKCDIEFPYELDDIMTYVKTIYSDEDIDIYQYSSKDVLSPEKQMLDTMREIIKQPLRKDRTGTGTYSQFTAHFSFDLTNNQFPLMTTRRMYWKGIVEELLLYVRGQTNSKILEEKGIYIWQGNTSREFLDAKGLSDLPEGDMGHSYGHSFRHFGAEYKTCLDDYTEQGFDQLQFVINEIKNNPYSRRLVISLWEPNHMHKAALPPCLYNYQFYVDFDNDEPKYLSCVMTQRSSDFAVAGGWNVATGALLTYMIAHLCNLQPNKLTWNLTNVHIYANLVDGVKEQMYRTPRYYPKLFIQRAITNIEDFTFDDFNLVNYTPDKNIKFEMSV